MTEDDASSRRRASGRTAARRPRAGAPEGPGPAGSSIEEEHGWLATMVHSCDNAIVSATLEGVIRSWNPGAERLYGYAAQEVIGRDLSILSPPGLSG